METTTMGDIYIYIFIYTHIYIYRLEALGFRG